jgi:hypothetical protein
VVGEAGDLVGRVADVEDRDGELLVQALQEGQDLLPAGEIERDERLVHQQQAGD